MPTPIPAEIRDAFFVLVNRLSPENLSCDGECSRTEQKRRLAQIRREWKALETKLGRKVPQEEIEDLELAEYRARMAARAARRTP